MHNIVFIVPQAPAFLKGVSQRRRQKIFPLRLHFLGKHKRKGPPSYLGSPLVLFNYFCSLERDEPSFRCFLAIDFIWKVGLQSSTRHRSSYARRAAFSLQPVFLSGKHSIGKYRFALGDQSPLHLCLCCQRLFISPMCCFAGKLLRLSRDRLSRFVLFHTFRRLQNRPSGNLFPLFALPVLAGAPSCTAVGEKNHFVQMISTLAFVPFPAPGAVPVSRLCKIPI